MDKAVIVSNRWKFVYYEIYRCATRTMLDYFIRQPSMHYGATRKHWKDYPEKWDGYFKFTFVRNPYSRIESFYFGKIVNAHPITQERMLLPKGLYRNMPFGEFVEYVINDKNCDKHWCPQYMFYDKINFIGKIENFDNGFKYILKRLNFPQYPVKKINYSGDKRKYLWTDKLKEKIYNHYKKDFYLFGYDKDYYHK